MRLIKKNIFLLLIILVAGILRFYALGSNPPSLNWDEIAFGYNAYSIGIDGKDEFGKFMPVTFIESFGDFKPPVYAYLTVLSIKIFGLDAFAVRFPSAFLGTMTVLITYFLTLEIFGYYPKKDKRIRILALLAALLLAISPWHIMLSRAAFEANVATFFIAIATWIFLYSVRRKSWLILLSAFFFALPIYTFNTPRVVLPIFLIILTLGFKKELLSIKKKVIVAAVFGAMLIFPTVSFLLSPQASLRFQEVNIFSDPEVVKTSNLEIANSEDALWAKIIYNRRMFYSVSFVKHYLDHFNPSFLFVKGDVNPRFSTQDVGEFYMVEAIFLILGTLFLFKRREGKWWLIPSWIIIGIIPAAIARETPHALRIETTIPAFQILSAYGFYELLTFCSNSSFLSRFRLNLFVPGAILFLLFINFFYFIHGLALHYPREYSQEWQYGYEEAFKYAKSVENNYDEIYVTEELGRPYIFYLFYTKYSPEKFREEAVINREALGFVHVNAFGKYRFTNNPPRLVKNKTLFITTPNQVFYNAKVIKTFNLLNGKPALVAFEI